MRQVNILIEDMENTISAIGGNDIKTEDENKDKGLEAFDKGFTDRLYRDHIGLDSEGHAKKADYATREAAETRDPDTGGGPNADGDAKEWDKRAEWHKTMSGIMGDPKKMKDWHDSLEPRMQMKVKKSVTHPMGNPSPSSSDVDKAKNFDWSLHSSGDHLGRAESHADSAKKHKNNIRQLVKAVKDSGGEMAGPLTKDHIEKGKKAMQGHTELAKFHQDLADKKNENHPSHAGWFSSLSDSGKKAYVTAHPDSKYARS